jgi:hypothetical protein
LEWCPFGGAEFDRKERAGALYCSFERFGPSVGPSAVVTNAVS